MCRCCSQQLLFVYGFVAKKTKGQPDSFHTRHMSILLCAWQGPSRFAQSVVIFLLYSQSPCKFCSEIFILFQDCISVVHIFNITHFIESKPQALISKLSRIISSTRKIPIQVVWFPNSYLPLSLASN